MNINSVTVYGSCSDKLVNTIDRYPDMPEYNVHFEGVRALFKQMLWNFQWC